ncbi:GNAT family N-acetyltransferase [Neobacillus sp. LXY-4]|uniref:GNAT family N-acetyltransferase n=1 Tax=Neobacillus sp. LXY-4 TaxID=3379826 RepID=UPI003EDF2F71
MLTEKQLQDIKELQLVCEAEESIELKLNWDMLETRNSKEENDFFFYENGKLVGFLGLYGFGHKIEACGMVAPEFRRRGIFSSLVTKALMVIKSRDITEILLNAPGNSASGKGFLQSIPCKYAFTEYQMKWHETKLSDTDDVLVRVATPNDFETEIILDVECFGFEMDEASNFNRQIKQEANQQFYMIEVGGEAVGKIRVSHTDGEAWIYGFCVFPDSQGIGIGRKALSKVILKEQQQGYPIFLEVEAKNNQALRLYETCGFKAYHSQDYYHLEL